MDEAAWQPRHLWCDCYRELLINQVATFPRDVPVNVEKEGAALLALSR
jgi:hypothetical protein